MQSDQVRHARNMASKIIVHAQAIVNEMNSITSLSNEDGLAVPISNMVGRFTHDMGYGVQDRLQAIEDVLTDMLPELEQQ